MPDHYTPCSYSLIRFGRMHTWSISIKTSVHEVVGAKSKGMKFGRLHNRVLSSVTKGFLWIHPCNNTQSGSCSLGIEIFERHVSHKSSKWGHSQCLCRILSDASQYLQFAPSTFPVWIKASCVYNVPFNAHLKTPCSSEFQVSKSFIVDATQALLKFFMVFLSDSISPKMTVCHACLTQSNNSWIGQSPPKSLAAFRVWISWSFNSFLCALSVRQYVFFGSTCKSKASQNACNGPNDCCACWPVSQTVSMLSTLGVGYWS